MAKKTDLNESRMTALTRIETGLERLERHMVALTRVNQETRRMLEEDRAAFRDRFRSGGEGAGGDAAGD